MEARSTKREWKENFKKETSRKTRNRVRQKINEIQTTKEGVNTKFLWEIMRKQKHFIGVIPQDYLLSLDILTFPVSLIINLDLSTQSGSHWIGISISEFTIELYDSLGMNTKYRIEKPTIFLLFLAKFKLSHQIISTPVLQNPNSHYCGFYCVYFMLFRRFISFNQCVSIFTTDLSTNDNILLDMLL